VANFFFILILTDKFLGWTNLTKIFFGINSGLQSMMMELTFISMITLWCDVCPDNLEATSITLFTGLYNLV